MVVAILNSTGVRTGWTIPIRPGYMGRSYHYFHMLDRSGTYFPKSSRTITKEQ